jgi:hypothetical protein
MGMPNLPAAGSLVWGNSAQPGDRHYKSRENSVDRSILDQVTEKSLIKAKIRCLSKNCKGCIGIL